MIGLFVKLDYFDIGFFVVMLNVLNFVFVINNLLVFVEVMGDLRVLMSMICCLDVDRRLRSLFLLFCIII